MVHLIIFDKKHHFRRYLYVNNGRFGLSCQKVIPWMNDNIRLFVRRLLYNDVSHLRWYLTSSSRKKRLKTQYIEKSGLLVIVVLLYAYARMRFIIIYIFYF